MSDRPNSPTKTYGELALEIDNVRQYVFSLHKWIVTLKALEKLKTKALKKRVAALEKAESDRQAHEVTK